MIGGLAMQDKLHEIRVLRIFKKNYLKLAMSS